MAPTPSCLKYPIALLFKMEVRELHFEEMGSFTFTNKQYTSTM